MNNCIARRSNPRHSEIQTAGRLFRRNFRAMTSAHSLCCLGVCLLLLLGFPLPSLHAQVQNGTIKGTATDSVGAVVTNAKVTLTQTATNLVMHSPTNDAGVYGFFQLLPGAYSVSIEKPGFKKNAASLTLTVGQAAQLDFALVIGSETQTVTVDAGNAVTLNTQTSNLDYTVQAQQVEDLPMNGRNPYGLAALSPGIMPGGSFGVGVAVSRGAVVAAGTNNFESNGGVGGNNEILLDGVSIVVCCQGQPAVTPDTDVVSQFKVVTSSAPAEYGRTSGAVLNFATKSGTNQLHGDTYDYLRNDKLDAANYFTKRAGKYPYPGHNDFRSPHRTNQYGVFLGGPVFIPRAYDGKDKTFFTFGYEGIRNLNASASTTTVPTALMRQGIFSEGAGQVYDPNSYDSTTDQRTPIATGTCDGTVYAAGYCIPQSSWNPVAKAMLALYPKPTASGTSNNYSYSQTQTSADDQYNFRIDHNFSESQRSFVRGTKSKNDYTSNDIFNTPNGATGWQQHITADLFAVGHLWTVSPTTLLQFTYGFARQTNFQPGNNFTQFDAANYGFSTTFLGEQQAKGLPVTSVSGLVTPEYSASFNKWAHYTHSLNATGLIHKGKHDFAIGYNGRLVLENQSGLNGPTGTFSFNTGFTGGPKPSSALPSGQSTFDAWAAFLLGTPNSGYLIRQTTVAFNQWVHGFYVQDDWRFKNALTINLGLRYDVETGFKERHNHWADFDPTVTNPISKAAGMKVLGGAQFLGADGNPSRTSQTLYHAVGPRLGFSYSVTPKIVVRGGYGIIFLPLSERGYSDPNIGFTQTTNMPTTATGFTPAVTIDNPLPDGVALPAGSSAGAGVSVGSSISGFQYKNPLSYQEQWNFGLQRSLGTGMSVSLNYVGGHGVKLPMNTRPNDLNPAYWGAVDDKDYADALQKTTVANPFYGASGVASGSVLTKPQVQAIQLQSAFPQYTSGAISGLQNWSAQTSYYDAGSVTYNAVQASLLINRPGGLTGSISYVFSKALGNVSDLTSGFLNSTGNPGIQSFYALSHEHSILATDAPHRIAGTATYPLPFGKGKRFGGNLPGWSNQVIGGWMVNAIIDAYSGFATNLSVSGAPSFSGSRPVFTGSSTLTSGDIHKRLGYNGGQGYFNPSGFRLPKVFELGTVPRSAGNLRGPVSFDDNVSVIKNFPIHDAVSFELRGEFFNVLNKVDFGLPNTSVGSTSFGSITGQSNLPRNIQLSGKLHF